MSRGKAKTPKAPPLALNVDDLVLCCGTRASYPRHWYVGRVLWVGDIDLLILRSATTGESFRQIVGRYEICAVGTFEELHDIKMRATKAARHQQDVVDEAERNLGRAREELWRLIEDLAAGGVPVAPPDFDAIDADAMRTRAACEQIDREEAAADE